MALTNPYSVYKKQSVQTLSQKQLLLMMYKGMIKFMKKGCVAIDKGDIEAAHVNLTKSGKILLELIATLKEDRAPELAENLKRLYVFCYDRVTRANLEKNKAPVMEVLDLMEPLCEAWTEILETKRVVPPQGMPEFKKAYI